MHIRAITLFPVWLLQTTEMNFCCSAGDSQYLNAALNKVPHVAACQLTCGTVHLTGAHPDDGDDDDKDNAV